MPYTNSKQPITQWAVGERPREKWMHQGPQHLSDAEVLAIVLGSGKPGASAVDLARIMLSGVDHKLDDLGKMSIRDLQQFPGVGPAKAIAVLAALELGRRRKAIDLTQKPQIRSSADAYQALKTCVQDLGHEEFWVLLLNRANRIIGRERISIGGVSGTLVDAKIVFGKALSFSASSIIMGHNHPSGSLEPSGADLSLTQKMVQAGKVLDIAVLDHLIITSTSYCSLADTGRMSG